MLVALVGAGMKGEMHNESEVSLFLLHQEQAVPRFNLKYFLIINIKRREKLKMPPETVFSTA